MDDANGREIKVGDRVKHAQPGHFTTLPPEGARVKELRGALVILDYQPKSPVDVQTRRGKKTVEMDGSNAFHHSFLVVVE